MQLCPDATWQNHRGIAATMPINNALASLAVADFATAVEWYQKLFGRAADATPMEGLAEWHLPGGGGVQVYLLPERAGHGSCTLLVADLDEESRRLQEAGIDPGQRISGTTALVIMIKDPAGNSIALSQSN